MARLDLSRCRVRRKTGRGPEFRKRTTPTRRTCRDSWNQHFRGAFPSSIAEDSRDCGIGTCIIEVVLDWARENPVIEGVGLGVVDSNARAIHVYEKLGFKEEGRGDRGIKFGPGRYGDVINMFLWLGAEAELP